jgi:hypothetical protein
MLILLRTWINIVGLENKLVQISVAVQPATVYEGCELWSSMDNLKTLKFSLNSQWCTVPSYRRFHREGTQSLEVSRRLHSKYLLLA